MDVEIIEKDMVKQPTSVPISKGIIHGMQAILTFQTYRTKRNRLCSTHGQILKHFVEPSSQKLDDISTLFYRASVEHK